ncbi:MAG: response regulator transcription factor [Chitinophagales bacterium]|nr:response regulator transcription factor [Bacteroidota bacterium]MCB9257558.1 response regulator transcription factor [Chitinophagales bacterium]
MQSKIKAILVDDSEQAIKLLYLMLKDLAPGLEVVATAKNAREGMELIRALRPDVLFLDIEMPEKSGLDLASELGQLGMDCQIIFTTAYDQYAIQAFRLAAMDYLLKPIEEEQLMQAVEKISKNMASRNVQKQLDVLLTNLEANSNKTLSVPTLNGFAYLPLNEIEFLEADGSYVHIHMFKEAKKTISKNLKYFENILESDQNFVRVHRSYLINMENVEEYSKSDRGIVVMKSGKKIDVARNRKQEFLDKLKSKFNLGS